MRQSLDHFEAAFHAETELDRTRRERLRRTSAQRSRQRRLDRQHARGNMRFVALALSLVATAAVVTVVMFEALYYVLG